MAWRYFFEVRPPSLYLSIYRRRKEGVVPLGFPQGGAAARADGISPRVTFPPSWVEGTLEGRPNPPGYVRWGEGGAQPLSGLVCPIPLAHGAPQHLSGPLETPFGHAGHHPVPLEQFQIPIPFVQYINLHLRTIPEFLVTSDLIRDTEQPSVTTIMTQLYLYRHETLSV